MGCWGVGPLETDAALDWLQQLTHVSQVGRALQSADHDEVYAAIGIIAWAVGWPLPEDPLELSKPDREKLGRLRLRAAKALQLLRQPDHELRALWEDSDHLLAWEKQLQTLEEHLRALPPKQQRIRDRLSDPADLERFDAAIEGLLSDLPRERRAAEKTLRALEAR